MDHDPYNFELYKIQLEVLVLSAITVDHTHGTQVIQIKLPLDARGSTHTIIMEFKPYYVGSQLMNKHNNYQRKEIRKLMAHIEYPHQYLPKTCIYSEGSSQPSTNILFSLQSLLVFETKHIIQSLFQSSFNLQSLVPGTKQGLSSDADRRLCCWHAPQNLLCSNLGAAQP